MERASKIRQEVRQIIQENQKATARKISSSTGITEADVHRCLNYLESEGEVRTHSRELLGEQHRIVGLHRE